MHSFDLHTGKENGFSNDTRKDHQVLTAEHGPFFTNIRLGTFCSVKMRSAACQLRVVTHAPKTANTWRMPCCLPIVQTKFITPRSQDPVWVQALQVVKLNSCAEQRPLHSFPSCRHLLVKLYFPSVCWL